MACSALQAFATATQDLGMEILRVPADADVFNGAIPRGIFDKNKGVTKTAFTMLHSEPSSDQPAFTNITLDNNGQPTPQCNPTFNQVNVGYYTRNYGPKEYYLKGPMLCRKDLTFMHNIGEFLEGYVNEIGRYSKRVLEFAQREDYMLGADMFVDPSGGGPGKYSGPNAFATLPIPLSDLTQDTLDLVADDLISCGATNPDSNGYIMNGGEGPLFTLLINRIRSALIVKNNPDRRQDARYYMPNELWKRINATRVIGNFRHVPAGNLPRANVVGGVLTRVNTYVDVTALTSNGIQYTNAYLTAGYEAAIVLVPQALRTEIVTPYDWEWPDAQNYTGEWEFVIGGERIDSGCTTGSDPLHDRGQHFCTFRYAPAPVLPYMAKVIWYARCNNVIPAYAYCH